MDFINKVQKTLEINYFNRHFTIHIFIQYIYFYWFTTVSGMLVNYTVSHKKLWFVMFVDLHGVNNPIIVDFKLLSWHHWKRSCEEMHRILPLLAFLGLCPAHAHAIVWDTVGNKKIHHSLYPQSCLKSFFFSEQGSVSN